MKSFHDKSLSEATDTPALLGAAFIALPAQTFSRREAPIITQQRQRLEVPRARPSRIRHSDRQLHTAEGLVRRAELLHDQF